MDYGSVCSGIESATVAWHPLGWRPVWFSEIELFPCELLQYRYPTVPNLGNMLTLRQHQNFINAKIDLLVGGTPCQSFSADYLSQSDPDGLFGKTSPVSLVLTQMHRKKCATPKRRTSPQSSERFLNAGIVARGACLTLNISEYPSDAVECSLSDILETTGDHLQRYFLSAKACSGILRRAEKRKKKLPELLTLALMAVVSPDQTAQ